MQTIVKLTFGVCAAVVLAALVVFLLLDQFISPVRIAAVEAAPTPPASSTTTAPTPIPAPRVVGVQVTPAPTARPTIPTTQPPTNAPPQDQLAAVNAQPSPPLRLSTADGQLVVGLIRDVVVAMNDGILTGSYGDLRDLGSPRFREANTPERLAQTFQSLRTRGVDFSQAINAAPRLNQARVNESGMLYLVGSLATAPRVSTFELLFEAVDDEWQLFGVSIGADSVVASGTAPATTPAAPSPAAPRTP